MRPSHPRAPGGIVNTVATPVLLAVLADVRHLLAPAVGIATAEHVGHLARERRIPPALLWAWGERHGAALLALTPAAGLGRADLVTTFDDTTGLDLESLELLSDLHRHPLSLVDLEQRIHRRTRTP